MPSDLFPVIDHLTGGRFGPQLAAWRAEGLSYEAIAARVRDQHGITVTGETVRRWCAKHLPAATAA